MLARRDVLAGLLFIGVAVLGLWLSRDYPIGTALRMGTGYVPRLLCWLLLGLGAVVLVQGLREAQDARPLSSSDVSALRPVIFVTASLVIFGLSIERLGLIISILLLIGVGLDHARRYLLRRAIRRIDHGHSGEPAGRDIVGGHLHRRAPDGAAGAGRRCAGGGGTRLVLRRLRRNHADRHLCTAPHQGGPVIRRAGIFLAHGARADRRSGARPRLGDQGYCHDRARPAARFGRHRRQYGQNAVYLRHYRADRRDRHRHARHRDFRPWRDHHQFDAAAGNACPDREENHPAVADPRGFPPRLAGGAAWHRTRLGTRRASRRRRNA